MVSLNFLASTSIRNKLEVGSIRGHADAMLGTIACTYYSSAHHSSSPHENSTPRALSLKSDKYASSRSLSFDESDRSSHRLSAKSGQWLN